MLNDKFRIKLKTKADGEEITIVTSLMSEMNGILHFPIDTNVWNVVSCDQTTGFFDKNNKEIFFSDSVKFDDSDFIYQVTMNDFIKVAVVDGDDGQMELHKCYRQIEIL
ncbi:hypothetical protein PP175_26190 (plasmid) [Aneurinibacillus sp. Ricciae_BoGa-3]|uniref:hypothetical protein n=1 Tax=Aneurinibacillus sp. Ricciae_BoGa-3 TaxID=3022697 RepID=UPI002340A456|nr:hypothetical protein [Aneurinibacillus sp. Ricciae_BoGa-3]WCK57558.1 hypothetical protein PP175_26190 [Aneurinibacillus sp. Ricciae_BoGa-3]